MSWCCACNSKRLLAPDSKGVCFVLLFFLNLERGKNVNAEISIMVNIHAVYYCVLTQSDTELVTEILNLEFILLIHIYFSYSLHQ